MSDMGIGVFSIRILKFWQEYRPVGPRDQRLLDKVKAGDALGVTVTGEPPKQYLAIDMVEYCAIGQAQRSTTPEAIHRLAKVQPYVQNSNDIAAMLANMRWAAIRPHYEAWKSGHEMPETGTPLDVWPGITPGQAEVLKSHGIRSVEELRDASDGIKTKIPLPNIRDICANAGRFLSSHDQHRIAASLEEKDRRLEEQSAQINEQAAQLEEMKRIVLEMQAAQERDAAAKRKQQKAA